MARWGMPLNRGVRRFHERADPEPRRNILVAVARYLAAHSPTERALLQAAYIARRLSRGDQIHVICLTFTFGGQFFD